MSSTAQKIGFIGLGIMGAPMAGHLLDAGHQLFVNTHGNTPEPFASRAMVCASATEVARQADIVFIMVPDTPDVEKVLFGEGGVAAGLTKGKTVVDCSSIDPIATKAFAKRITDLGCGYIDAPVSGGEVGAKAASLTIMCGGDEGTFGRVRPLGGGGRWAGRTTAGSAAATAVSNKESSSRRGSMAWAQPSATAWLASSSSALTMPE